MATSGAEGVPPRAGGRRACHARWSSWASSRAAVDGDPVLEVDLVLHRAGAEDEALATSLLVPRGPVGSFAAGVELPVELSPGTLGPRRRLVGARPTVGSAPVDRSPGRTRPEFPGHRRCPAKSGRCRRNSSIATHAPPAPVADTAGRWSTGSHHRCRDPRGGRHR